MLGPLVALGAAALALFFWAAGRVEAWSNGLDSVALPTVSPAAEALHRAVPVVDLHADTLLWNRDLLEPARQGHVDLPRLKRGGVSLQVFTIVTQVPWTGEVDPSTASEPDAVTLLALLHRWPLRTVTSRLERALYQARKLECAVRDSGGALLPIRNVRDLDRLFRLRARDRQVVGGLLGVEGAHALEGRPENVAALFDAGVRLIGLVHLFDNEFAGSLHGVARGGLTDAGRRLLHEMERRGILVDLAHASARTIDDVLGLATRPVLVSHTGVRGTCDRARNLSDAQLRQLAANGGVVGIGFWSAAVCGTRPDDVARAVRHAVEVVGDRHIALGSDYDGVRVGFDSAERPALTQALLDAGLPRSSVRRILGENALRVLRASLPAGEPDPGPS